MQVLEYIFRIGVILAVYNFLWWLIILGLSVLRGGRQKQLFENYLIKFVRYLFLADVIFLFSVKYAGNQLNLDVFLISGLVLLIYIIGRAQSKQEKNSYFSVQGNVNIPGMQEVFKRIRPPFSIRYEVGVIILIMLIFVGFYFFSNFAENVISVWFLENILKMEEAPVFGFIFKVVGFFYMVSILFKVINGFLSIFSPRSSNSGEDYTDEY